MKRYKKLIVFVTILGLSLLLANFFYLETPIDDGCERAPDRKAPSGSIGGCFISNEAYAMQLSPQIDCLSFSASSCNGADIQFTNNCPTTVVIGDTSLSPNKSGDVVDSQTVDKKTQFTLQGMYNDTPFNFTYKVAPYACKR